MERLFGPDLGIFSDFLQLAAQCLVLRASQPDGGRETVGLVASWTRQQIIDSTAKDLCSKFFGKLLRTAEIAKRFSVVVKLFVASPLCLDSALMETILESMKQSENEEPEGFIVVADEKNEALVRFLKFHKFIDLKTDLLISSQELLCKDI